MERAKSKKKGITSVILIIGVLIIPLIYSGLYLASVWDAYGNMDDLPVAVVNEDKGAIIDGKQTNLGQQLVDTMAEDKTLDWSFVDKETAEQGLKTGNVYYAVIQIPENFSQSIASAETTEKSPATITYSSNEKRNYIASTIMKSAMLTLKDSVKSSVSEQISESLVQQLERVPSQMETLNDGLQQLSDGSDQLNDGMAQLSEGNQTITQNLGTLTNGLQQAQDGAGQINSALTQIPELINGAQSLEQGANAVNDGASQLNAGASALQNGVEQVNSGAATLNQGISQLSGGISQAATGAQTLSAGAADLDANLQQYVAQVNQLMAASGNSAAAQQMAAAGEALLSGSAQVSGGAANLNGAMGQLVSGSEQVAAGSSALQSGIGELSDGATSLTNGIANLSAGTQALSEGSTVLAQGASKLGALQDGVGSLSGALTQLADGAQQLYDGSQTLQSGIDSASDGATQLGDGIKTAKKEVSKSISNANKDLQKTEGLSEFTGTSVDVDAEPYDSVENYGSAFAPYFMNISLWTGGLTMMMSVYLDYKRRMKILSPDSDEPILRTLAFYGIAIGQALLVAVTVQFGLGLQINNVPMYYAGLMLSSLTFISIIQFLLIHLDDVGKIIAMVLLVFQLTSTGGSFPVEMTPGFFQFLNHFMPMTYGILFQREAISGSSMSFMGWNALVMACVFVAFTAATLILDYVKLWRKKNRNQLEQPSEYEALTE